MTNLPLDDFRVTTALAENIREILAECPAGAGASAQRDMRRRYVRSAKRNTIALFAWRKRIKKQEI
jgi:hypothetical protein